MAKTKISEFSATANSNTDINSINIAEGCAPSNINDAIRELMAELKDFQAGTKGDSFNGPVGTTTAAAGAFTTLSSTGNTTLGDASGDTVTINGTTTFANVNPTLSAGTANGVLYLNGSKVATSGSALTFDGTTFAAQAVSATGITNNVNLLSLKDSGTSYTNGNNFAYLTNSTNAVVGAIYHPEITSLGISGNSALVFGIGSTPAEQMRLTSTGLGIGTSSPANKLQVVASSSGTNDLLTISRFDRGSSGTAANGIGGRLEFSAQDNAGSQRTAAWLNWKLADVSSGGPKGYLSLGSRGTSEALIIDDSGNLGLGVTPSAWSGYKPLQAGSGASFGGYAGDVLSFMGSNTYNDNTNWRYILSGNRAARYQQDAGVHSWHTAGVGTAGNAISFTQAMTLDANSVLNVYNAIESTGPVQTNGANKIAMSLEAVSTGRIAVFGADTSTFGTLVFSRAKSNGGTTESARITSGGDLLVGASYGTGGNRIVAGNVGSYTGVEISTSTASARPTLTFVNFNTATYGSYIQDSSAGDLCFGRVNYDFGGHVERARIDSSGNLLINKTTATTTGAGGYILASGQVSGTRDGGAAGAFRRDTSDGDVVIFLRGGTQVGSVSVTTTATAYNTSSDYRLKENIQPMTGALAKVQALKPCTYNWKADGSDGEGFIAHELAEIVPQAVTGQKDAVDSDGNPVYQGIDTSFLVATLTAAIKEQQAIIEQLKADVAALKGA